MQQEPAQSSTVPAASLPDFVGMRSQQQQEVGSHLEQSPASNLPVQIHQPSLPTFIHDEEIPDAGSQHGEGKAIFAQIPGSTGAPLRMTAATQPMRTTGARPGPSNFNR